LSYGYLLGPRYQGRVGALDILLGVLEHQGAAAQVAGSHVGITVAFLAAFGLIGLFSPWAVGMAFVVLGPNVLDQSSDFISVGSAFQSWPAMPFILVGTVMILLRLFQRDAGRRAVTVIVVVWATVLGELAVLFVPAIVLQRLDVGPSTAAALSSVASVIPAKAEVIVTQPVVGRFAQRESAYSFSTDNQTFPVNRRLVVFVMIEGLASGHPTKQEAKAAVAYIGTDLHARLVAARANVYAFTWSPPPDTTRVTLP
jgi:hypothetical protein